MRWERWPSFPIPPCLGSQEAQGWGLALGAAAQRVAGRVKMGSGGLLWLSGKVWQVGLWLGWLAGAGLGLATLGSGRDAFRRRSFETAHTQGGQGQRRLEQVAFQSGPRCGVACFRGSRCRRSWRKTMKIIASSLLVLGLLAVQVSEANAVVCARGVYRGRMRRTTWRGRRPSGLRLRRGSGGAPPLWLRRGSGGAPPGSRLLMAGRPICAVHRHHFNTCSAISTA